MQIKYQIILLKEYPSAISEMHIPYSYLYTITVLEENGLNFGSRCQVYTQIECNLKNLQEYVILTIRQMFDLKEECLDLCFTTLRIKYRLQLQIQ